MFLAENLGDKFLPLYECHRPPAFAIMEDGSVGRPPVVKDVFTVPFFESARMEDRVADLLAAVEPRGDVHVSDVATLVLAFLHELEKRDLVVKSVPITFQVAASEPLAAFLNSVKETSAWGGVTSLPDSRPDCLFVAAAPEFLGRVIYCGDPGLVPPSGLMVHNSQSVMSARVVGELSRKRAGVIANDIESHRAAKLVMES